MAHATHTDDDREVFAELRALDPHAGEVLDDLVAALLSAKAAGVRRGPLPHGSLAQLRRYTDELEARTREAHQ